MASLDYTGIRSNQYRRNQYITINGHKYLIQCPQKIDANTVIYIAGRGAGDGVHGGIADTYTTFNAAKGKNVIVIAPRDIGGFDGAGDVATLLANEFIVLLKETAVCGYVALVDLTRAGDIVRAATYQPFMPLIGVAIVYLILVMFFTWLVGILERRLRNDER